MTVRWENRVRINICEMSTVIAQMQKQAESTEVQRKDSFGKSQSQLGVSKELHTAKPAGFCYLALFTDSAPFCHSLIEMVSQQSSLLQFSLYSNFPPQKYCNSLSFSPTRAVHLKTEMPHHCRNTPILRLPCTTFLQWFHLSNWLKITSRSCK